MSDVPVATLSAVPLLANVMVAPPANGRRMIAPPVLTVMLESDTVVGTLIIVAAVLNITAEPGHGTEAGDQLEAVDQLVPDVPIHVYGPPGPMV